MSDVSYSHQSTQPSRIASEIQRLRGAGFGLDELTSSR